MWWEIGWHFVKKIEWLISFRLSPFLTMHIKTSHVVKLDLFFLQQRSFFCFCHSGIFLHRNLLMRFLENDNKKIRKKFDKHLVSKRVSIVHFVKIHFPSWLSSITFDRNNSGIDISEETFCYRLPKHCQNIFSSVSLSEG